MSVLRRTLWLLFAAGVLLGTFSDERIVSLPRQEGGWWILAADLHVHGFFGDGALPPWDLRREAERRGLDAIVITNHNQIAASRFGAWMAAASPGPLLLPGEEITAPRYHLIATGVRRSVDWRQPLPRVIESIHAQGGVAIAAHPSEPDLAVFDDDEVLKRLDGIEGVPTSLDLEEPRGLEQAAFFRRAVRTKPRIALVGASDFHSLAPLGSYRTYLLARERTEAGVMEAIRGGRTVACDPRGRVDGDARLLPLVRHDCAAAAGGVHAPGRWAKGAGLCAWSALLALMVLPGTGNEEGAKP